MKIMFVRLNAFGMVLLLPDLARAMASVELAPRTPLPKQTNIVKPSFPSELTVKFRDDLKVRAGGGNLTSLSGGNLGNVQAVQTLFGLTFESLIQLPQPTLDFIETQAAQHSGIAQPDLAGMMVVHGSSQNLEAAAQVLNALSETEWVEFGAIPGDPPCTDPILSCGGGFCQDLCPSTLDYFACRGSDPDILDYHGPNPGINMACAWQLGYRGQFIQVADCETAYSRDHEDLCSCRAAIPPPTGCNIHEPPSQEFYQPTDGAHGSAVLGVLAALAPEEGNYGWRGLVPDAAAIWFYTVRPQGQNYSIQNNATAIANATNTLLQDGVTGDVLLLEVQTIAATVQGTLQENAPLEIESTYWTLILSASHSGLIVVEGTGNGGWNLDCPNCPGMSRTQLSQFRNLARSWR